MALARLVWKSSGHPSVWFADDPLGGSWVRKSTEFSYTHPMIPGMDSVLVMKAIRDMDRFSPEYRRYWATISGSDLGYGTNPFETIALIETIRAGDAYLPDVETILVEGGFRPGRLPEHGGWITNEGAKGRAKGFSFQRHAGYAHFEYCGRGAQRWHNVAQANLSTATGPVLWPKWINDPVRVLARHAVWVMAERLKRGGMLRTPLETV